jgi:sulfur carrier protein
VQVIVNGRASDVPSGISLPELVESLGLRVGSVVVEHNGVALLRSELAGTRLAEGDRVELVRAVAGG